MSRVRASSPAPFNIRRPFWGLIFFMNKKTPEHTPQVFSYCKLTYTSLFITACVSASTGCFGSFLNCLKISFVRFIKPSRQICSPSAFWAMPSLLRLSSTVLVYSISLSSSITVTTPSYPSVYGCPYSSSPEDLT